MLNLRIILLLVMLSELCVCHESRHVLLHLWTQSIMCLVFTSSERHPHTLLSCYNTILLLLSLGLGARGELEDSHWPQDVRKEQTLIEYHY